MKTTLDLKELLHQKQLKITQNRLQLLEIISNYQKAIPYSEIQNLLKEFDRVTLYRNLQSLLKNGVIHIAASKGDVNYYALCQHKCSIQGHQHQHIHFTCNQCLSVTCVPSKYVVELEIPDHKIDNIEIEVKGICKKCVV